MGKLKLMTIIGTHKELPLAVVPVLSLGDTRFRDVDGDLSAGGGLQKLREAASLIHIHLQRKRNFFWRQIGQIGTIELLCKAAIRDLWQQKRLRLLPERSE